MRVNIFQNNLSQEKIEIINPAFESNNIRYALLDFDGTISLIRQGWQDIMIPMMVEILEKTPHHEEPLALRNLVKHYVTQLTGKQTIYQMIQLCEEITKRGGTPKEPLYYKHVYNERLNEHIKNRKIGLKNGIISPSDMVVKGSLTWLKILQKRGIVCYLASGTDEKYVFEEAELLGITPYFQSIYGAKDDYKNFSKKMLIQKIIKENHLHGNEFIAFGDGFVEIEDTKSVNGIAVGVASDENQRKGIDEWKRSRLIAAGADIIIADFLCAKKLESLLFVN